MDNKKRLFVGNLPYSVTDDALLKLFSDFGTVVSAKVISDKYTNRSKGFGFVEFETQEEAQKAVENLHDKEIEGRKVIVSVARPREN